MAGVCIFHQRFRSVRGPGDFNFQSVQIVAEGIRWIEDNIGESNLEVYLRRSGLRIPGDDGLDDLAAVNLLTAKIAPASDREVSFGDNKGARDDLVAEIAKAEEAIRGSNEMRADEKSDSLISLDLGKSLILKSINFSIGAVRYLILDRIKKAFEKVIEDVFRIALILCFIAIATAIVALI